GPERSRLRVPARTTDRCGRDARAPPGPRPHRTASSSTPRSSDASVNADRSARGSRARRPTGDLSGRGVPSSADDAQRGQFALHKAFEIVGSECLRVRDAALGTEPTHHLGELVNLAATGSRGVRPKYRLANLAGLGVAHPVKARRIASTCLNLAENVNHFHLMAGGHQPRQGIFVVGSTD